jgi:hypothetical protein
MDPDGNLAHGCWASYFGTRLKTDGITPARTRGDQQLLCYFEDKYLVLVSGEFFAGPRP